MLYYMLTFQSCLSGVDDFMNSSCFKAQNGSDLKATTVEQEWGQEATSMAFFFKNIFRELEFRGNMERVQKWLEKKTPRRVDKHQLRNKHNIKEILVKIIIIGLLRFGVGNSDRPQLLSTKRPSENWKTYLSIDK